MPSFTSKGPGTTKIASPVRGQTLKTPTKTTPVEERTWAKLVAETTCPVRKARLMDIDERYRNGTWDGIPRGFSLVEDGDGIKRLKKMTKEQRAAKSKDIGKSEEVTALFNLGGTKTTSNKSGSDDDGLGQDFDDMLNGMDVNPNRKGNVTPLQSLMGTTMIPTMRLTTAVRTRIIWVHLKVTKAISRKTHNEIISR
jgi:hypothetical protein